eukprot:scaffold287070_cov14-Prasinocladus_malaysianus.AAC.1
MGSLGLHGCGNCLRFVINVFGHAAVSVVLGSTWVQPVIEWLTGMHLACRWARIFCRGGGLGSKRDLDTERKRGFSEADQENLYNDTQWKSYNPAIPSGRIRTHVRPVRATRPGTLRQQDIVKTFAFWGERMSEEI